MGLSRVRNGVFVSIRLCIPTDDNSMSSFFGHRMFLNIVFTVVVVTLLSDSALALDSSGGDYRPCILQIYGDGKLRRDTKVPSAAARLSVGMALEFSRRQRMTYHLYDCDGFGHCSKAPSIKDACYAQQCSHVLYIDADLLMHNPRVDVVGHMIKSYPEAVLITGVDYYGTMANPSWHDGTWAFYRTDSNAGMILFSCNHRLSFRIISEWERLCRRYSPIQDDQAALSLMKTFPQYQRYGVFVRDALILGQYSIIARHFPGDGGKKQVYPLASDRDYEEQKEAVSKNSGLYKYVRGYWKSQHVAEIPPTEQ